MFCRSLLKPHRYKGGIGLSVHSRFLQDSGLLRLSVFAVVPAALLLASISCAPKDSSKDPNPAQPPQPAAVDYTGAIIEIESDSQLATIVEAADICVVLLYSDDCGACHFMDPFLRALMQRFGENLIVCRVDCDRLYMVARKYKPTGYPTVLIIKDGREFDRLVGTRSMYSYTTAIEEAIAADN